jgi:tetratricopeptide (TPR) repeat protein
MRRSSHLLVFVLPVFALMASCPFGRMDVAEASPGTPRSSGTSDETAPGSTSTISMLDAYRLGVAAYKAKEYETADQYLSQALTIWDPDTEEMYYAEASAMRGIIHQYYMSEPDHLANAQKFYREALRIDPSNSTALKHANPLVRRDRKSVV